MRPAARTMPIVTATWSEADQRWSLQLPGGRTVTGKRAWVIERHVRRELPGTSLRFDPGISSGLGLEQSVAERPSWQAGERTTRRAARRVPISESAGADQGRGIAAHQPPMPADSRSHEAGRSA